MDKFTDEELLIAYRVMLALKKEVKESYSNYVTTVINELANEFIQRKIRAK